MSCLSIKACLILLSAFSWSLFAAAELRFPLKRMTNSEGFTNS